MKINSGVFRKTRCTNEKTWWSLKWEGVKNQWIRGQLLMNLKRAPTEKRDIIQNKHSLNSLENQYIPFDLSKS